MVAVVTTKHARVSDPEVVPESTPWYIRRLVDTSPCGFNAGDTNLYRYVGNDPTNATDPSGLLADDPGKPSLPPPAEPKEKEKAIEWINKELKQFKLDKKDYEVQGPLGSASKNNWDCSGLVQGAQTKGYDWSKGFPDTTLPLKKSTFDDLEGQMAKLDNKYDLDKKKNTTLEKGKQKIVVLGDVNKDGIFIRHYALQLPDGTWISKLGIDGPTIIHEKLEILQGKNKYGEIIAVYSRPNPAYKK